MERLSLRAGEKRASSCLVGFLLGACAWWTSACETFASCEERRTCAPEDAALGGGAGDAADESLEGAPRLTISYGFKSLHLSWSLVPGASEYRLLRRGPAGDFEEALRPLVGSSHSLELAVHAEDWESAVFRVEACGATGCVVSAPVDARAGALLTVGSLESEPLRNEEFGSVLALSGDGGTLAVSAPGLGASSIVYVFRRAEEGWKKDAELVDPSSVGWGAALALSEDGTSLAVGAPGREGQPGEPALVSGTVSVFHRGRGVWERTASLQVDPPRAGEEFGSSVAFGSSGRRLFVGAPGEDSGSNGVGGAADAGAVFVFDRSADDGWTEQARLLATFARAGSRLGSSLSTNAAGDVLVAGAPFEDIEGRGVGAQPGAGELPASGAVYVFRKGSSAWSVDSYVKASAPSAGDRFGASVALAADGRTLVVGAPFKDGGATGVGAPLEDDTAEDSGAAYVYRDEDGVWGEPVSVKAPHLATPNFAESVALSGDGSLLAVGQSRDSSARLGVGVVAPLESGWEESGAAFVYRREGASWRFVSQVKSPAPLPGDHLGASLALDRSGHTLAVGAPSAARPGKTGSIENAGIVYVY